MTAAPAALAWEFWARHRIGLAAVATLVASFAIYGAVVPMTALFASISSIWFVMGLFYVVGVFAYGFEGRLESADSGFPARLFVLPVRTRLLVAWPMVQGMALSVLLWTLWDRLVLRPSGVETPAWWSSMLAAIVAVSQALVWLPFGLPWLRLLVIAAVLTVLVQAPAVLSLVADAFADPSRQNAALTIFALALIPAAYLIAWRGVSRARHGDGPDWMRILQPFSRASTWNERAPFRSALQAQTWYEWRRAGLGLVITVGLMIALVMAWGEFVERTDDARTRLTINFLLLPVIVGSFWGLRTGSTGDLGRGAGLSAFAATRPLGNTLFVAAKLRAAAWSAVFVWLLVLVLSATWLIHTGGFADVGRLWDLSIERYGMTKTVGLCAFGLVAIPLLYWRCLVANLWIGLVGRAWVAPVASIVSSSLVLHGMYLGVQWESEPARFAAIREMLPWFAGFAIVVKLLVGAGSLRLLVRRHQLNSAMALRFVAAWIAVAAVLIGCLAWLIPREIVAAADLAAAVVLLLPFARTAVAPLALGLNRHR